MTLSAYALCTAPLLRVLRTEIIDAGAIAEKGECAHELAANFVQCCRVATAGKIVRRVQRKANSVTSPALVPFPNTFWRTSLTKGGAFDFSARLRLDVPKVCLV